MDFYQQVINLVIQPPGNLAYHLVLAAAAGGTLISAFNVRRQKAFPQGNRTIVGLSILLALQLVFLITARASYSPDPGAPESQILLEQAGALLGILTLLWLWLFPEPDRPVDMIFLSAGSLVIFAALVDYFLMTGDTLSPLPGMTWSTLFWTFLPLLILSIGFTGILLRLPNGWLYGAWMLGILGVGYILSLILPPTNGTYPGAVRLVHLAAYPLLFTLPERFRGMQVQPPSAGQDETVRVTRRKTNIELPLLESILQFAGGLEEQERYYQMARLVAQSLISDVCLIISAPDPTGESVILAGFDLIRMETFPQIAIDSKSIPLLSTYIQQGRMLHLPASSTSRDLINLTQLMQLGQSGNLLASPLHPPDRDLPVGIVVMSPYSQRTWTKSDQVYLAELTEIILETLIEESRSPHKLVKELQGEIQEVSTTLEETERENAYLSQKLTDCHAILEEAQKTINSLSGLKDKYLELKEDHQRLTDKEQRLNQLAFGKDASEQQQNLKAALTEIAELRAEIRSLQTRLENPQEDIGGAGYSLSQIEALTSFAQRLRFPLRALLSSTEEKLSESKGLINSLENQLLDQLQTAQGEIDAVLGEVLEGPGAVFGQTGDQPGDMNKAIEIALRNVKFRMREREVDARVDLPVNIPPVKMDHYALLDILMALISNAVKRTEPGGSIQIRSTTYQEGSQLQLAYLNIADQGSSIPASQLLTIFGKDLPKDQVRGDSELSEDLYYLAAVKTRVEEADGRVWIDSKEEEAGLTISLLLPFASSPEVSETHP